MCADCTDALCQPCITCNKQCMSAASRCSGEPHTDRQPLDRIIMAHHDAAVTRQAVDGRPQIIVHARVSKQPNFRQVLAICHRNVYSRHHDSC